MQLLVQKGVCNTILIKKIDQLVHNLNIKYGLANIHTMDLMSDVTGLGIAIPITSIDEFIEFDSNLNDNKEKVDIVVILDFLVLNICSTYI